MPGGIKITNLPEFNRTLTQYAQYTRRTEPIIVNTKAFYIARRAAVETPRANAAEIKKFFGLKKGEIVGKMINKRRGQRGEKGLYGAAMAKEVAQVLALRTRARGFLASGWIWAIKKLAPFAEKIGSTRFDAKFASGKPKGSAIPAVAGNKVAAHIANTVSSAWDKRAGALAKADPALMRAFEFERASMLSYIERKQKEGAKRLGIKLLGG